LIYNLQVQFSKVIFWCRLQSSFSILLKLESSNRELNLELRFPFCFFKLISMGKTLWGEKILKHKIYLCSNGFNSMLFMKFRIVFIFWHSSVYNCEYFAQNKNFLSHPQTKSPCFNSPWKLFDVSSVPFRFWLSIRVL
jgi:hypothetical protein